MTEGGFDGFPGIARGTVVATGTLQSLRDSTGQAALEDAFVQLIGSDAGLE